MTPITGVATLAGILFLGVLTWNVLSPVSASYSQPTSTLDRAQIASTPSFQDASPDLTSGTTTPPSLGDVIAGQFATRYQALVMSGASPDTAAQSAADIVPNIAHRTFTKSDITIDQDTSLATVLKYRDNMREALAPLLNNTTPEFEIYARYVDTRDVQYLDHLSTIAKDYRVAIEQAQRVHVPQDATAYHIAVLNAMSQFAETLDGLVNNAQDSVASISLLRTYNEAEEDMFASFNALGQYAARKTL